MRWRAPIRFWLGLIALASCGAHPFYPDACRSPASAFEDSLDGLELLSLVPASMAPPPGPGLWQKLINATASEGVQLLNKAFPKNQDQAMALREALSTLRPSEIAETPELRTLLKRDIDELTPADGKRLSELVNQLIQQAANTPQTSRRSASLEEKKKLIQETLIRASSKDRTGRQNALQFIKQLEIMLDKEMADPDAVLKTLTQIRPELLRSEEHLDTLRVILQTSSESSIPLPKPSKLAKQLNSANSQDLAQIRQEYGSKAQELIDQAAPAAARRTSDRFEGVVLTDKKIRQQVADYSALDPNQWKGVLPDFIFSNAMVSKGTGPIKPLKRSGGWKSNTTFLHGTSPEGRNGILGGKVHLTSGWGEVDAGFYLDVTPGHIARTYAMKGGVMLEVTLDPEARTIEYASPLWNQIEEWIKNPEAEEVLKEKHPTFYRLLKRDRPNALLGLSRDQLARAFGAQVLINRVNYGGSTFSEAVVLDASVIRKVQDVSSDF